ncbi:MAG: ATP-binding protein [Planctomycetota bacterium]
MSKSKQLPLPYPHLKFSPGILKRLGEELNPNPDQGILELVKNSHDADAGTCRIKLENVSKPGGTIVITDDGVGMDQMAIENNWLLLGKSDKSVDEPTALGRIPVGNKGLGRLAALRLGTVATLVSSTEQEPSHEYEIRLNWAKYDTVDSVEEVPLDIKRRKRKELKGPGTQIRIENLRVALGRNDVKRIARGLLLLADPFDDDPVAFRPILVAKEYDDLSKLVEKRYFDDAEFHLIATINEEGLGEARVLDWEGSVLYEATHKDLRRKQQDKVFECPTMTFDLWNFILDKDTFSTRNSTINEVQDWLGEFGGVHLYLRRFRVPPYGNPGNDWLDLNLRRSRSPEGRPSTNNSIGRVSVLDPQDTLVQKTDRTGLIEDEAFSQMKVFAGEALDWMARRRLEERESKRQKTKKDDKDRTSKAKDAVETAINKAKGRVKEELQEAFDKYDKARVKEEGTLRREVQLYRTLSTAGITAALFSHESLHPLEIVEKNIKTLRGRVKSSDAGLDRIINRISNQVSALSAFGSLTLSQVDRDKRRARRVEIHRIIADVAEMFEQFATIRKVQLDLQLCDHNPYLRTSEAAVESILANLLANSLRSFEQAPPGKHRILLATHIFENNCVVVCSDNGLGISGISLKEIWLPGETTRDNGTGLGLTIVRDTVQDIGGTVDADAHGPLGGAEFRISIPILGT